MSVQVPNEILDGLYPDHPNVDNLKAIELVLLPPKTTSKTGSNQGIEGFLSHIVKCQIKSTDAGRTTPKINILESRCMLVRSWDTVSAKTAKNCFRNAGVSKETHVASVNDEDDPFKLLEENVNELKSRDLVDGELTVDDYINRF